MRYFGAFGVSASGNVGTGLRLDNSGVEESTTKVLIRNGFFFENSDSGVGINDVGFVHATRVAASDNGDDGFYVVGAHDVRVTNSWFFDNGDDGLEMTDVDFFWFAGIRAAGNGDEDIVWNQVD